MTRLTTMTPRARKPDKQPDYPVQSLEIGTESIRLGQLLKLANLAEDGFEAKHLIEHGNVTVNGEVVTQRGKQVREGDLVTLVPAKLSVKVVGPEL